MRRSRLPSRQDPCAPTPHRFVPQRIQCGRAASSVRRSALSSTRAVLRSIWAALSSMWTALSLRFSPLSTIFGFAPYKARNAATVPYRKVSHRVTCAVDRVMSDLPPVADIVESHPFSPARGESPKTPSPRSTGQIPRLRRRCSAQALQAGAVAL